MGPNLSEPFSPRRHVLVLLPERPWNPYLVEGMDYPSADHPVRN